MSATVQWFAFYDVVFDFPPNVRRTVKQSPIRMVDILNIESDSTLCQIPLWSSRALGATPVIFEHLRSRAEAGAFEYVTFPAAISDK